MDAAGVDRINRYIQRRISSEDVDEVTANDAAKWLDEAGLLKDSLHRPGLNLRNLLRAGLIEGSVQRPPEKNGRWFIRIACPFCERLERMDIEGEAASFPDAFPSAPGHRLVVPVRHVARVEELGQEEWSALFDLVRKVATEVAAGSGVDGINIGVNGGEAAGQTVGHAHVHVIPRREGDVGDPRGGVRWVLPETADYWTKRDADG
jgi:diadenosine tetraphosphate (Ap4A) HIT family hydrolase